MGKDKRIWRKLVKKLRRSRIRIEKAKERDKATKSVDDEVLSEEDHDLDPGHDEEEKQWELREEEAQLAFRMKQAQEQAKVIAKEALERRIREEWEEIKKLENEVREREEREAKERSDKQVIVVIILKEEEFNQLLDFLAGDIENPPQPFLMPEIGEDKEVCSYFARIGACRFFDRCERAHPKPTLSSILLIPNFFSHFSLEQSLRDEFNMDLSLEFEDADMDKEFLDFYEDVLPEFRALGKVVQFKVCCNYAPHLRGNVYIQFDNIREAVQAFRKFNARFYNGRQLSLQFVKIPSWRAAICGRFSQRRCTNGKTCNYLHVFRNPTKEFISADHDWEESRPIHEKRKLETERLDSKSRDYPRHNFRSRSPEDSKPNLSSSKRRRDETRRSETIPERKRLRDSSSTGSKTRLQSIRSGSRKSRSRSRDVSTSRDSRHKKIRSEEKFKIDEKPSSARMRSSWTPDKSSSSQRKTRERHSPRSHNKSPCTSTRKHRESRRSQEKSDKVHRRSPPSPSPSHRKAKDRDTSRLTEKCSKTKPKDPSPRHRKTRNRDKPRSRSTEKSSKT